MGLQRENPPSKRRSPYERKLRTIDASGWNVDCANVIIDTAASTYRTIWILLPTVIVGASSIGARLDIVFGARKKQVLIRNFSPHLLSYIMTRVAVVRFVRESSIFWETWYAPIIYCSSGSSQCISYLRKVIGYDMSLAHLSIAFGGHKLAPPVLDEAESAIYTSSGY